MADLIELHVVFERPKADQHMQGIANKLVEVLQADLGAHFAVQRPRVYVADIRDSDEEDA